MGYDDYWGRSFWGGSYYGDSYWAEYRFVNPPSVGAPSGVRGRVLKGHKRRDLFEDKEFLGLLEQFLEII